MAGVEIVQLANIEIQIIRQMVQLHQRCIPTGFLTSLGAGALEAVYRGITRSSSGVAIVAVQDGACIGFLAASVSTRRVQLDILIHAWPWLVPAVLRSLAKPAHWLRFAELFYYPNRSRGSDTTSSDSEILNFCVDPSCRGHGIGGKLFEAMCRELAVRGINEIHIVTGADQVEAQRLYERRGAKRVGETSVHRGSRSIRYLHHV